MRGGGGPTVEKLCSLVVLLRDGLVVGGLAVRVLHGGVRAVADQQLADVQVAAVRRQVQRRVEVVVVLQVHVTPAENTHQGNSL